MNTSSQGPHSQETELRRASGEESQMHSFSAVGDSGGGEWWRMWGAGLCREPLDLKHEGGGGGGTPLRNTSGVHTERYRHLKTTKRLPVQSDWKLVYKTRKNVLPRGTAGQSWNHKKEKEKFQRQTLAMPVEWACLGKMASGQWACRPPPHPLASP